MKEIPDSITTARLKQLCNLDVPYTGYVDDGYGTIVYVCDMQMNIQTFQDGTVASYEKSVSIKISEVIHTVKKGDNLSLIAQKLGISVDQIVQDNKLTTPDLIYPGDVLKLKTEIQYGYRAGGTVDLSAFLPGEDGYQLYPETVLYDVLNTTNSVVDAMAGSLNKHAGSSTIGNNRRIYWEKPSGRAFYGNQYVKTYGLKNIGKAAKNITLPLAIGLEVVEIRDGFVQDERTFGHNAQKQFVGALGMFTGAAIGAKVGAAVGAWFGGVGAVPGALIGTFVGGLIGGILGEMGAEECYEAFSRLETGQ